MVQQQLPHRQGEGSIRHVQPERLQYRHKPEVPLLALRGQLEHHRGSQALVREGQQALPLNREDGQVQAGPQGT